MTLSAASRVRFAATPLKSHNCALSSSPVTESSEVRPVRASAHRKGWVTRMREQNLDTPDIARLVRGDTAGDRQAWERLVAHHARLTWASTAEFKRTAQLRGAPPSAGSRYARWRSVSCLAKGVLRQGCS